MGTQNAMISNLRFLMDKFGYSQSELSRKSGVSQRTISYILSGEKKSRIETAELLAKPFGLEGWHLIMPNLPDDLIDSPSIEKLIEAFKKASAADREMINQVADRAATYSNNK